MDFFEKQKVMAKSKKQLTNDLFRRSMYESPVSDDSGGQNLTTEFEHYFSIGPRQQFYFATEDFR
jgi:hypothetical protein